MANKLLPISNDLIFKRMRFENPWWESNRIEEEYENLERRLYYDLFFKLVEEVDIKRAVVLMGPRRVGKTVLMHHAIHGLLHEKKIRNNKICFITIENPLYLNMPLDQLFQMARQAVQNDDPRGWYVFFDEIQYLKEWEVHLKLLVDSYPQTKFIVSGSAAAALKIKSNESGAGRFTEFMLPPLTFHEYIHLKQLDHLIIDSTVNWVGKTIPYFSTNNIEALNKHFVNYINYGGYPEVIFSSKIQSNLARYIKGDIIDKVLLRDLPSLYGIQNVQELNSFFTMLVYYTGNELSYEALSEKSGVNKPTLKKYLEYLEAAFLIKMIHRIDDSGKKFTRKTCFKIYLTNPSLRSALFSPLEATDNMIGAMVETAIFAQRLHRESSIAPVYAKWNKGEIDMIGLSSKTLKPQWALEIKWSNRPVEKIEEIKNLISFCNKNKLNEGYITTLDQWDQKEVNGIKINYIPCSVYAYNVGFRTIGEKLRNLE
jgi:predicted AAA+ superfamily ATPase